MTEMVFAVDGIDSLFLGEKKQETLFFFNLCKWAFLNLNLISQQIIHH